jgi:hypothetical protein
MSNTIAKFNMPVPTFDATIFSWDDRRGTCEASDLGLKAGALPFTQCYNDACDAGMKLFNPNRGTTEEMILSQTLRQPNEGEVYGWEFYSLRDPSITAFIFND